MPWRLTVCVGIPVRSTISTGNTGILSFGKNAYERDATAQQIVLLNREELSVSGLFRHFLFEHYNAIE